MSQVLALIDCNNFFVSCERLFRPDLENQPVVVLSSNDGCVVSRSNEAKALGIPMGAPAFKYRCLFKEQGVVQFSANFELYGDISQRITRSLIKITPQIEVYSVDESFLDLTKLEISNYEVWAQAVRYCLLKDVGVPVAIGIAPTKTLAKIASERAKKDRPELNTMDLMSMGQPERQQQLKQTPINDVWGVGWRLTPKLKAEGVMNALDLANLRPQLAQQLMGILGRQMVMELNGEVCHQLEAVAKVRQSIMHGRMFGEDTDQFMVLEAAIASLSAKAAKQLRAEGLLAKTASLYLSTNKHRPGFVKLSQTIELAAPTADSGKLTAELVKAARSLVKPNMRLHRANIAFYDLVRASSIQVDLFGQGELKQLAESKDRFLAFDSINQRYGHSTIQLAAENLSQHWRPKRKLRSPGYTTDWVDLPKLV